MSTEQVVDAGAAVPADPPPPPASLRSRIGSAFAMFRNGKSIAGLIILGFFLLIANIAADFAYAFLDPRTRQTEA